MDWKLVSDSLVFAKNYAKIKNSKIKTLKQIDYIAYVIDSSDSFLQQTL